MAPAVHHPADPKIIPPPCIKVIDTLMQGGIVSHRLSDGAGPDGENAMTSQVAKFTALDQMADRSKVAYDAANNRRDLCATAKEAGHIDQKSYKMGESFAYNDARKIMEKELRRLCNRLQNGCLSVDDFGVHL